MPWFVSMLFSVQVVSIERGMKTLLRAICIRHSRRAWFWINEKVAAAAEKNLGWRVGMRRLEKAGPPSVARGFMEVGRVPYWAVAMSEDHSGAVRGGPARGAVVNKGAAGGGAKAGICASSALVAVLGIGRATMVGTLTVGTEGGGEGKTEVIGTAAMGIWSSSLSDDMGSRWDRFSHLDCFSVLILHFSAFMLRPATLG